jgi:hypothetical protein
VGLLWVLRIKSRRGSLTPTKRSRGAEEARVWGFGPCWRLDPRLVHVIHVFIRREDAERFIEEVCGDDPELASYLRIEERELEAGMFN